MFVSRKMTPDPVTITPATTVADASEIMRVHKFRRLPVVDNGSLVGIVTDRDLREVSPSPATTLSIFELNYLLAKMQVKEMMRTNVVTISPDATIEEAALLMYTHKIGGLVVVDQGRVVGIITETDIFKTFVEVMGLAKGKTRITLRFDDHIGALNEISQVFKDLHVNIGSLVSFDNGEPGKITMVIRSDITDTQELQTRLEAAGYQVTHITTISR